MYLVSTNGDSYVIFGKVFELFLEQQLESDTSLQELSDNTTQFLYP